jgi:hypothetical protein
MGYLITFLIGVLALLGSLYLFSESVKRIKTGSRALAVVDELLEERSRKGKYSYRPVFKFTALNGQEIHYRYDVASSPSDWELGEKATVVYSVNDPENPMVLTYFGAFKWAIILLAIATPLLIISGGNYVFHSYIKQYLL